MNRTLTLATAVSALVIGVNAMALSLSKQDYNAEKDRIESEYRTAWENCKSMHDNAKDVCEVEAKGNARIARTDLEARFKPSTKATYNARMERADVAYDIAKQKCDDLLGNVKDVCFKEAKADHTAAVEKAKLGLKQAKNDEEMTDAKYDATAKARDAQYNVAREKCQSLKGEAREQCNSEAKSQYDK